MIPASIDTALLPSMRAQFPKISHNVPYTSKHSSWYPLPLDTLKIIFDFTLTPFCDPVSGKLLDKVVEIINLFDLPENIDVFHAFWEEKNISIEDRTIFVNKKILRLFMENFKYENTILTFNKKEKISFIKKLSYINNSFLSNSDEVCHNFFANAFSLDKNYKDNLPKNMSGIKKIDFKMKLAVPIKILAVDIVYQSNKKYQFLIFNIDHFFKELKNLEKINEMNQKDLEKEIELIFFKKKKGF